MNSPSFSQKRFWALAVPNILANLSVPFAGLIDIGFLGHLPEVTALSGIALGTVFFDYCYWTFGFLRMGTTGLAAQAFGRDQSDELRWIWQRGLLLAFAIGGLLLLFRQPIIQAALFLLQGDPETESQAFAYISARIWGAPCALTGYVCMGWLMATQRARSTLVLALVLNGGNAVLDYWFIVHLGWGIRGAGWATALSEAAASIMGLVWVGRAVAQLDRTQHAGFWNPHKWWETLSLNRDITIRTFCLISAFAVFNNLSALLGHLILAANALILKLLSTVAFFIDGLAFAVEALAGSAFGKKDTKQVKTILMYAFRSNAILVLVSIIGLALFANSVLWILTDHQAVVEQAMRFIPWLLALIVFSSFAYILDGYFIGISAGKVLRTSMLWSLIAGFLPLAGLGIFLESNHLLWAAFFSFMVWRALSLWRKVSPSLMPPE
ncbi:MAG: MATE family efflux transporter [Acidobacteria bacterium]|nr:MATE family efflux transporter [Acidobacteriota bacterium]MCB9397304.1 MATE family efflux transporter [Acidobacteriota bacterium]